MKIGNLFKGDKVIWMIFFILFVFSVVEVFSASSFLTYKGGSYWAPVTKHTFFFFIGTFLMIITLNIRCKFFKLATPFLIGISFIMLFWVLIAGTATNDANRWISFAGIQFQPSEIAKGTMVLLTAQILASMQTEDGAERKAFTWIMGICMPMVMLIGLENLSTAMLIFITLIVMMVVGRVPMKQIGGLMGVCAILVSLAIAFVMLVGDADKAKEAPEPNAEMVVKQGTDSTQTVVASADQPETKKKEKGLLHRASSWKRRILDFFSGEEVPPEKFDLDRDAQVGHANIAIASSNIIGRGPGNSVERDFLSQAFSDFIYAIIIEETGIIGAGIIAFLYIVLLFRAGKIASRCENNFPAFLIMGLAVMLVTQALFNMCVAVGLAPVTGQPLPLVSRGGTSTIINCVYLGMMLSISRSAKKKGSKPSKAVAEEPVTA